MSVEFAGKVGRHSQGIQRSRGGLRVSLLERIRNRRARLHEVLGEAVNREDPTFREEGALWMQGIRIKTGAFYKN